MAEVEVGIERLEFKNSQFPELRVIQRDVDLSQDVLVIRGECYSETLVESDSHKLKIIRRGGWETRKMRKDILNRRETIVEISEDRIARERRYLYGMV